MNRTIDEHSMFEMLDAVQWNRGGGPKRGHSEVIRVGKFAFLLRVDGSTLRYTGLFKIRGPQKAKLKKGWVEVEIGVPQSWWYNDEVEGYKKHLSQAIEEGLHSMVEVLQTKSKDINADVLFRDWAKIKEGFLSSSDD